MTLENEQIDTLASLLCISYIYSREHLATTNIDELVKYYNSNNRNHFGKEHAKFLIKHNVCVLTTEERELIEEKKEGKT